MPVIRLLAHIPLTIDCPEQMLQAVRYVLAGEYESHHDGERLQILDIGANVGSFALWADLRWPGSTIHCYEPNPGTFEFLTRNVAGRSNISCVNAAVYPTSEQRAPFFSRFPGDGEAGLVSYARDTFRPSVVVPAFDVDIVTPDSLPKADIVKIDIEGGEAAVLAHIDLSTTSLVLTEFHNRRNRAAMRDVLAAASFEAVLDEECPWDPILDYLDYRAELKGDAYGHMFYARRGQTRLTRQTPP
jgi:FkbM family methyltransferase